MNSRNKSTQNIKKTVTLAMLAAMAVVATLIIRVPFAFAPPAMRYDPQDVFILLGGFIFGPLAAAGMSAAVALIRFAISSTTGHYGLLMNFVSTFSFVVPAAIVYFKIRSFKGAIVGLIVGMIVMVPTMLLMNYLIVPLYTPVPREAVVGLLIPAILPFNLLKGGINAAIILMIYNPIMTALNRAKMLPEADDKGTSRFDIAFVVFFAVAISVLFVLTFIGVIDVG